MAWRRSITSSDSSHDTPTHQSISSESSHNTPTHQSISSDSATSYQSGTSAYYRRIHKNCSRQAARVPQCPSTPEESSDDDKENVHPAEMSYGEPVPDDEEEPEEEPEEEEPEEEPYQVVGNIQVVANIQEPADSQLQAILDRFEAQSSYTGPPGFGAGSSVAAALQHELNLANLRIADLEAVEAVNEELADRVASLSVANVMMGLGQDAAARFVNGLWMAMATLIVLVVALLARGW